MGSTFWGNVSQDGELDDEGVDGVEDVGVGGGSGTRRDQAASLTVAE